MNAVRGPFASNTTPNSAWNISCRGSHHRSTAQEVKPPYEFFQPCARDDCQSGSCSETLRVQYGKDWAGRKKSGFIACRAAFGIARRLESDSVRGRGVR